MINAALIREAAQFPHEFLKSRDSAVDARDFENFCIDCRNLNCFRIQILSTQFGNCERRNFHTGNFRRNNLKGIDLQCRDFQHRHLQDRHVQQCDVCFRVRCRIEVGDHQSSAADCDCCSCSRNDFVQRFHHSGLRLSPTVKHIRYWSVQPPP